MKGYDEPEILLYPLSRNCLIGAEPGHITVAAIVGAFGWSGEVLLLPVACLFPVLWAFAPTRLVAGLVSMAYFMAASRGLPVGVSIFYATDMWLGLLLWVAASACFVTVHTALWTLRAGWRKAIRYAFTAILMSVPPFGAVAWASPITAAGVLFPGWGWGGLAAAAIGLLVMTTRLWPISSLVLGGALAWSAAAWTPPTLPERWVGINTDFHYAVAGKHADYEQHLATITLVTNAAKNGAATIVLPESALGIWTPTSERLWLRGLNGLDISVIGGAIVLREEGYDNVMIEAAGQSSRIVYRQRMPAPLSMWRPWEKGGASASLFGDPIGKPSEAVIAPLICHEQLIVWPILQSMLFAPDIIVAIGNGWWTGDTNIVAIQKASATAWAKLFGLSLVIAFNT